MHKVNVFLGSSFRLSHSRRMLGDEIRKLNDGYLKQGVRICLKIWEDFPSVYIGKSKQQEYIDEMVLKSEICIFAFADRIGKFTRQELEAKLKQNASAVHCYFMYNNKHKRSTHIKGELDKLCKNVKTVNNDNTFCSSVKSVIDSFVISQNFTLSKDSMNEIAFYTTIPNDMKNKQAEIGTGFRNLDDVSLDNWGIHCKLNPIEQPDLLHKTDHYIPMFKDQASDEDFKELKTAVSYLSNKTERLHYITVFNFGDIQKDKQVGPLLVSKSLYPKKATSMDSVKWELAQWLLKINNSLVQLGAVSVRNGKIYFGDNELAPISALADSLPLQKKIADLKHKEQEVATAIASPTTDDQTKAKLVSERNEQANTLNLSLMDSSNGWVESPVNPQRGYEQLEQECKDINAQVSSILTTAVTVEAAYRLKQLLLRKEELVEKLVRAGESHPKRLLATQLMLVGVFDTYIKVIRQPEEEDRLYKRIIDSADHYGIKDPNVEMMRMNNANSLSRKELVKDAIAEYRKAVDNLNKLKNGSKRINRYITLVLNLLSNHCIFYELPDDILSSLALFKNHINSLPMDDAYLPDCCLFQTCKLTAIHSDDNSQLGVLKQTEKLNAETRKLAKESVASDLYDDVFVRMPNMIARYYMDHWQWLYINGVKDIFEKAKGYLLSAIDNNKRLMSVDYGTWLFQMGELNHNLGFLCQSFPEHWWEGLKYYEDAIGFRRRYFSIMRTSDIESSIAQSLVNYAALGLLIIQNIDYPKEILLSNRTPLINKAKEAIEIYKRHIDPKLEVSEQHYYEGLQLLGTIEYEYFRRFGSVMDHNQAIEHFFQCYQWDKANPNNSYHQVFQDYSVKILREERIIKD